MMPLRALKPVENMPIEPSPASLGNFQAQHAALVQALYAQANCARWGLSEQQFAECLWRSAGKRFGGSACSAPELENYLQSLHLEDLALACACSLGIEAAWEFFVAHFRDDLRRAAGVALRASGHADDARANELADSLYAELYGVRSTADGRRKSLFEYFQGRSKLSTWLRAVLAQRHVDMLRTSGRTVSLETESAEETPRVTIRAKEALPGDPDRAKYLGRFEKALSAALASLTPRERLVLASYYVDGQNLAQIGALLREHESTVSRQLERERRALRERVTEALGRSVPARNGRGPEPALDAAQIELAFEYALEDWPFDLSRALSNAEPAPDSLEE
jgi:RNA polymerase sigma-70 factor